VAKPGECTTNAWGHGGMFLVSKPLLRYIHRTRKLRRII